MVISFECFCLLCIDLTVYHNAEICAKTTSQSAISDFLVKVNTYYQPTNIASGFREESENIHGCYPRKKLKQ